MSKVVRELWEGKWVRIDVRENDSFDIKCGGPSTLGFDFVVAWEEDNDDLKEFLTSLVRSYLRFNIEDRKVEVKKLWTRAEMAACIKKELKHM